MRWRMVAMVFAGTAVMGSGSSLLARAQAPSQEPVAVTDCADSEALKAKREDRGKRLQDWPNLARYREANAVSFAPEKNDARVVIMGDSITDGWSRPQFGRFFPGKPY